MELNDGDFMDIDFVQNNSNSIVIALHGLEGSAKSTYMLALSKRLSKSGFDIAAVNFRGCSGIPNRSYASYHSGKTEDLNAIITYILDAFSYKKIYIVGYSLGGNILLKYLGEQAASLSPRIKASVAISVPCDLASSSEKLGKRSNWIYMHRFLKTLKSKAIEKNQRFPEEKMNIDRILKARNFRDFDNLYTAPAHGFENAESYWKKSSSNVFLKSIASPTLLINAKDDPFLTPECFPYEIAKDHKFLTLETPKYGGHVGFNSTLLSSENYWLENRILSYIKSHSDSDSN